MSSPAPALETCTLTVNLSSGARTALPAGVQALLTLRDGNQKTVNLPNNGFVEGSGISITGLPFFDNFGDNYAVVASADDYLQAGFFPVKVNPAAPAVVDIMLLGKNATFNFRSANWRRLKSDHPDFASLLAAGTLDDASAGDRYGQLLENNPKVLACFFNLVTAMSQIHLPSKTPLDYIKELIWDETMGQDRFFAWADPAVIDQV